MAEGVVVDDGPPQEVLVDFDKLRMCRVLPTSLLEANVENLDKTGAFLRVEALAMALKE